MDDLYPRQQAGLTTLLVASAIEVLGVAVGWWPPVGAPQSLLLLFMGIGLGMLSGNTRTKRVPGNRRRR